MDQSSGTTKVLLETPYRTDNLPPEYEGVLTALRKAVGHHGRLARPTTVASLIMSYLPEYGERPEDALQVVNFLRNQDILVSDEGDALVFFDPLRQGQIAAAEAYLRELKPTFGEPPCRTFHELIALVGAALTVDENTAGFVVASLKVKRFLIPDPVDPSLAWVDEQPTQVPDAPTAAAPEPTVARVAPLSPSPPPGFFDGQKRRRKVRRLTVRVPIKKPNPQQHRASPRSSVLDELQRLERFITNRTRFLQVFSNLHRRVRSLERRLQRILTHTKKREKDLAEKCDRVAFELREAHRLVAEFKDYARSAR